MAFVWEMNVIISCVYNNQSLPETEMAATCTSTPWRSGIQQTAISKSSQHSYQVYYTKEVKDHQILSYTIVTGLLLTIYHHLVWYIL